MHHAHDVVPSGGAAMPVNFALVTDSDRLGELAGPWRELVAESHSGSYFATPDWVLSWTETVGAGTKPHVGVWWGRRGELEAVVPLGVAGHRPHPRLPIRLPLLINLGSGIGAADHCGFAVRPARVGDVRSWLAEAASGRSLLLSNLDPEAGVPFLPSSGHRIASSACPRVDIPADPAEIGASAKFRKQLRAYQRKVEKLGISFRWISPQEMTGDVIETVFDLHERRRAVAGWVSSFERTKLPLHLRLAARAGQGRGPAAVMAYRDETAVAVLYGFRWQHTFSYYQTGWDPALAEANLATVLVAQAMRLAGEDGATVFDFLRGAEAYKYRFGATDRVDQSWLFTHGSSGALMRAKYRWVARREKAAAHVGDSQ